MISKFFGKINSEQPDSSVFYANWVLATSGTMYVFLILSQTPMEGVKNPNMARIEHV